MASTSRKGGGTVVNVSSSSDEDDVDDVEEVSDDDDSGDDGGGSDPSISGEESSGFESDADESYVDEDEEDVDEEDEEEEEEEIKGKTRKCGDDKKKKSLHAEDETQTCYRIVELLRREDDLGLLKLEGCKAYLRKHNLRITGTKAICIQRIMEHWRIKDGMGEKFYPASSFIINCTGDVCKGDVIMFKQRVYEKYDKVTRGARIIGKRTIAGRVVKESYGAEKHQHTFTVEILWSRGAKVLPALFPLLVKGRNLYKLKTFRQRWDDETERSKVLLEKHKRGAAARKAKAIAKSRHTNKGFKRQINLPDRSTSSKRRKTKKLKITNSEKQNKKHNRLGENGHVNNQKMKTNEIATAPKLLPTFPRHTYPDEYAHHSHSSLNYQHHEDMNSYSMLNIPVVQRSAIHRRDAIYTRPYIAEDIHQMSSAFYREPPLLPFHNFGSSDVSSRNCHVSYPFYCYSVQNDPTVFDQNFIRDFSQPCLIPRVPLPTPRQSIGPSPCSASGCRELAAKSCVVSCCSRCCKRIGRPCDRHR